LVPPPGRQVRLGVDGLQSHDPQQPLHPLAVHLVALAPQPRRDPPAPVERAPRVLLVDPPHQGQVLGRLGGRLVVERRRFQADQLALPADAQLGVALVDQAPPGVSRGRQLFFTQSSSTLSRPICSYSSAALSSGGPAVLAPEANTASAPASSCF